MKLICPKCGRPFPAEDMNMAADTALCRHCDEAFAVSELVDGGSVETNVDLSAPPAGAWLREDGMETRVGATMRCVPLGAFLSIMLVIDVVLTVVFFGQPLRTGRFEFFKLIPLVPLLIGAVGVACVAMVALWGRIEVRWADDQGEVFTGVGAIGKRRRFRVSEVQEIRDEESSLTVNERKKRWVVLQAGQRITFGSVLSSERQQFLFHALRAKLRPGRGGVRKQTGTSRETKFQAER